MLLVLYKRPKTVPKGHREKVLEIRKKRRKRLYLTEKVGAGVGERAAAVEL